MYTFKRNIPSHTEVCFSFVIYIYFFSLYILTIPWNLDLLLTPVLMHFFGEFNFHNVAQSRVLEWAVHYGDKKCCRMNTRYCGFLQSHEVLYQKEEILENKFGKLNAKFIVLRFALWRRLCCIMWRKHCFISEYHSLQRERICNWWKYVNHKPGNNTNSECI